MIDLHTHILPGIDDGPASVEEALLLTEALKNQNIHTAVCTPHFNPASTALQDFCAKRKEALKQMSASRIILLSGSETLLHPYLFHYPDLSSLCIENTRYLLIEIPYEKKWNKEIYTYLEKLIQYYNVFPIIAHIERYQAFKHSTKRIKKLIKIGCLLQLNTKSLLNKKYSRRAFQYIKRGYIDVLSSDCHNLDTRPPVIIKAYDRVEQKLGREYIERFDHNAEFIVNGIEIREETGYIIQ